MKKVDTALAAVAVLIALIALIPAFGQWLFPRHADPADGPGVTPAIEPSASAVPAAMVSPTTFGGVSNAASGSPSLPVSLISFPEDGAFVDKIVMVKGSISRLSHGQRAYLCVRSTAFGRLIFPQGEILPEASGEWSVRAIYTSVGYKYQTFVVIAATKDSIQGLGDGYHRSYGMPNLLEGSSIVGSIVTVERR